MKFLTISKFLLVLILPFLLFLLVANFTAFDRLFYDEKFSEYGTRQDISQASELHKKVVDFIRGAGNELPESFNEREAKHLLDVRNIVKAFTIALYIFIILFIMLLVVSAFILKVNNKITNFVGKVLTLGGLLTIFLSLALFFFISSDFSAAFESFHKLFFAKGGYVFDPAKEIIVQLYPEQLFMDLGIRISKWVFIASIVVILLGMFLLLKSKKGKK